MFKSSNPNSIIKSIGVIVAMIVVIAGAIATWGVTKYQVKENTFKVEKNRTNIERVNNDMIGIKKDIEHIRINQEKQDGKLEQILEAVR